MSRMTGLSRKAAFKWVTLFGCIATAAAVAAIRLFPEGGSITLQRMWVYGLIAGGTSVICGALLGDGDRDKEDPMNVDQTALQNRLTAAEAAFNEANADRAALIVLCAGLKDSFKNIPMAVGLSPLDMAPLDALLAAHLRPEIVAAINKLTAEARPA